MKNTEHLKSSDGSPFAACDDGRHGADCEKAPHSSNGGYLHAAEDDSPYNVDGLTYCGRCHKWMPRVPHNVQDHASDGAKSL